MTVASHEPIATMIDTTDTNAIDKLVLEYNSRQNGYSRNDARHSFFALKEHYGQGFNSATMLRLQAVIEGRRLRTQY